MGAVGGRNLTYDAAGVAGATEAPGAGTGSGERRNRKAVVLQVQTFLRALSESGRAGGVSMSRQGWVRRSAVATARLTAVSFADGERIGGSGPRIRPPGPGRTPPDPP